MDTATEQKVKEFEAVCERLKARIKEDKEVGRQLLIRAGILTKKGNLRKPYRNLRLPKPE